MSIKKYLKPKFEYNDEVVVFGTTGLVKGSSFDDSGLWVYAILVGEMLLSEIPEFALKRCK